MTDAPGSVAKHTDATRVFVPLTIANGFVEFAELATGRRWAYAFTSEAQAKEFLRVLRQTADVSKVNRLLPCTLGEWFAWQPKKNLPDLAIDPDPGTIADYPLGLAADAAKFDIQCLTQRLPTGSVHRVSVTPRPNPSQA